MRQKAYHITIVLSVRDTSSLQDLRFSPSGTAFFIFAASFTEQLVDPAVDPTGFVVVIIIVVVVIVVVAIVIVVIVVAVAAIFIVVVVVIALGKEPSEPFEGIVVIVVIVVTLSLDSFGQLRLDHVKRSHEPHANIWRTSK